MDIITRRTAEICETRAHYRFCPIRSTIWTMVRRGDGILRLPCRGSKWARTRRPRQQLSQRILAPKLRCVGFSPHCVTVPDDGQPMRPGTIVKFKRKSGRLV